MNIQPRQLFLLDGIGALFSAFMLGVILVRFESVFGMPSDTLYFLAFLPCLFAVYDFICYFLKLENWRPFLKFIAIANVTYCIISIVEIYLHYHSLTTLGLGYFIIEIIIVFTLAMYEFSYANKSIAIA